MKVFKFGGASVKDAEAVKNVAKIISSYGQDDLVIVVSAMGKTTNALEKVAAAVNGNDLSQAAIDLETVRSFHEEIVQDLFGENKKLTDDLNNILIEVEWIFEDPPGKDPSMIYDQIVGQGELLSTKIVAHYLNSVEIPSKWVDARDLIQTDDCYRNASVNWEETGNRMNSQLSPIIASKKRVITQGFIGSTDDLMTTTLGREGSDFTGAIIAYSLNASSVTIWKDVPGVLNADPKEFPEAELLSHISYLDAVELAYFGTSVIHPKTIKPLQNKGIPLLVRSFLNPEEPGTLIDQENSDQVISNFIVKPDQVLVSIQPKDFSFMVESHLGHVFSLMNELRITSNLMQNSALSFSFCMDMDEAKLEELSKRLEAEHHIKYNENCRLLTIRHFTEKVIDDLVGTSTILLDQRTRNTVQLVLKA